MFEGSRLSYIVPGYTGHIPKVLTHDPVQQQEKEAKYQIPGYIGYIPSIKSENIFAKTYGKITYNISKNDYHQGQDVPRELRYNSLYNDTFVNQREVLQRTAAEIVGVKPLKTNYKLDSRNTAKEQFWHGDLTQSQQKHQQQNNPNEPLKIGTPLPGYTGVNKRVQAANIFGQTYANSRKTAISDQNNVNLERTQNFLSQASQIPPIKK